MLPWAKLLHKAPEGLHFSVGWLLVLLTCRPSPVDTRLGCSCIHLNNTVSSADPYTNVCVDLPVCFPP